MTRTLQRERHGWNQPTPPSSLASTGAELSGTKNYHLSDVVAFLAQAPTTPAPNGTFRWFFKAILLNTRDHPDRKIKLWTLSLSVTNSLFFSDMLCLNSFVEKLRPTLLSEQELCLCFLNTPKLRVWTKADKTGAVTKSFWNRLARRR